MTDRRFRFNRFRIAIELRSRTFYLTVNFFIFFFFIIKCYPINCVLDLLRNVNVIRTIFLDEILLSDYPDYVLLPNLTVHYRVNNPSIYTYIIRVFSSQLKLYINFFLILVRWCTIVLLTQYAKSNIIQYTYNVRIKKRERENRVTSCIRLDTMILEFALKFYNGVEIGIRELWIK